MIEPVVAILTLLLDVAKLVATPIKRQFDYLSCFDDNVQSFRNQANKLDELQVEVDHSKNYGQQNSDNVLEWLKEAKDIKKEVREIEEGIDKVQSGCLGIKSRYVLSRKAVKMAKKAKKHHDGAPVRPAQSGRLPVRAMEFPSRKEIEENVMKVLREQKPGVIGICGMGGLGKTTMAEKLMERGKKEELFDETLMVVVGQDANTFKIQQDIADRLKFNLENKEIANRAYALHRRLWDPRNKIFIIMDDIWNLHKFEDLGIPCEACTVLLTSRNSDVFRKMDVKPEVFMMKFLNDEEALDLFIKETQIDRGDRNLIRLAEKFVKECQGLPLTLVVIGSLLKAEKDTNIWNDRLDQLTNFRVEKIEGFDGKVYRPLKFSFDKLDDVDAKKLLLLFGQFPEDSEIRPNDLALFCMSLRLFGKEINKVEQTRNRVH